MLTSKLTLMIKTGLRCFGALSAVSYFYRIIQLQDLPSEFGLIYGFIYSQLPTFESKISRRLYCCDGLFVRYV